MEHDLFDFMLLSLPDNDWHSHRSGPEGQLRSIALADVQLARVMDAAGGVEEFLRRSRGDRDGRPLPSAGDGQASNSWRSSANWGCSP